MAAAGPADPSSAPAPPADRLVFFFSGFDPKGAPFYHRLAREAAAARQARGDEAVIVGGRHRVGRWASAWHLRWPADPGAGAAGDMHSHHHFMRWDDIVRRHWSRSAWQLLRDYAGVYGLGIPTGVFSRIWSKSRAAWGLAVLPLVVAMVSLTLGVGLSIAVLRHEGRVGPVAAVALGAAIGVLMWRAVVRRIDCEWLLRLYAFSRLQALGRLPALEARLDEMAAHLVETVQARQAAPGSRPLREVMLVGYSTGSMVAASVLARALPRLAAPSPAGPPAIAMLSLGHCIPVGADWGAAVAFRAELQALADCPALTWHDYSAPGDWAAFWRTPPWPTPARLRGHQASPRFHRLLDPQAYAQLRRDRREMHLQYLRAGNRPVEASGYDYLALTAGPSTLAERHARIAARPLPP